ncbi:MAG: alpha/beta fold hydrolase [Rhodobacteraceae bacterium]|nr:alpha/beta fold hydrolase [Paracoccaceae bacterium]
MTLEFKRRGPDLATSLVVFLHGYGANGADLLGLAEPLAPHMPGTAFVAPDAPEQNAMNPGGFQWFPIPWMDGSSQEQSEASVARSADDLNAFLDHMLEVEALSADRMILVGFSQGTMMSLQVAPRRAEPVAGVVGFSGRLLAPERLEDEVLCRPPILLLHGDQDPVVPPESLPAAANALTATGFEVYAHVMKGTEHGIAPDGLSVALAFMRDKLGLEGETGA